MFSQVGERNFPSPWPAGKEASARERREGGLALRDARTHTHKKIIPAMGFWAHHKPGAAPPAPGDGITERGTAELQGRGNNPIKAFRGHCEP